MKRILFAVLLVLSLSVDAAEIKVTLADVSLFSRPDCEYVISGNLDFKGAIIRLPKKATLSFDEGCICNATVIGDDTFVDAGLYKIFDNVSFDGRFRNSFFEVRWFVDKISTSLNQLVSCVDQLTSAFNSGINCLHFTSALYYVPETIKITKRVAITGDMLPLSGMNAESSNDKLVPYGLYTDRGNTIFQIDYAKYYPTSNTYSIGGITCIADYSKKKATTNVPLISLRMSKIWGFDFDANLCSIEHRATNGVRTKHGIGLKLYCDDKDDYGAFLRLEGSIYGFKECIQIDAANGWINDVQHSGQLVGVVGIRVKGKSSPLVLNGQYQTAGGYAEKNNGAAFIYQDNAVVFNSMVWDLAQAPSKYVGATCQYALSHTGSGQVINNSPIPYNSFSANNIVFNPNPAIQKTSVFAEKGTTPNSVETRMYYKSNGKSIKHKLYNEQSLFGGLKTVNTKDCTYVLIEDKIATNKLDDIVLELEINGDGEIFTYGVNYFYMSSLRADKSFFNGFKYANITIAGDAGKANLFETDKMLLYNSETNINGFVFRIPDLAYMPKQYSIKVTYSSLKKNVSLIYLFPIGISNESAVTAL